MEDPERFIAVKYFKNKFWGHQESKKLAEKEIKILQGLSHPNVV